MKVVDVNLLIYAVNESAPLHAKAKAWVEEVLSGTETVALPWTVVLAFLRLTTRPGLFAKPLRPEQAFDLLEEWLNQPSVVVLEPSVRHMGLLREILLELGTAGNLTTDAHLAGIAMAHGAELCSTDSDFGRIAGLRWRNPLQARKQMRGS